MSGSLDRIGAMVMRHWYLLRRSKARLTELMFWPTFEIVLWGFMSVYLSGASGRLEHAAQFIIGAAVLWSTLARGTMGVMISFMEEMWSRNLGHMFVAPMRPWEFVASILAVASMRTSIGVFFALIASVILFNNGMLQIGPLLVLHFSMLLVMSWCVGMICMGMILRWGMGAEWLSWIVLFAIMPLCCVYYPLSALPSWLHPFALALPATHVFEGMRHVLATGDAGLGYFAWSGALNLFWLTMTASFMMHSLAHARAHAALVQQGE